jgi:hypothetical protein
VAEVEDEIEMESVPAAVKAAVKKAARGGGKITKLEQVKKGGKVTGYEVTVVTNGKKKSLELNPDGVLLK